MLCHRILRRARLPVRATLGRLRLHARDTLGRLRLAAWQWTLGPSGTGYQQHRTKCMDCQFHVFSFLVCWFDGVVDRTLSAVEVVVSGKSAGDYGFRSKDSSFAAPYST
jgi:hypothetical protein